VRPRTATAGTHGRVRRAPYLPFIDAVSGHRGQDAAVHSERVASFVVSSTVLSTDEIRGRIHLEADKAGSDTSGAFWELREVGSHDVDLNDLIARAVRRVVPVEAELRALVDDGAACLLRIVAYLSPSDGGGTGFVLDKAHVEFLAKVGAFVDADLYAVDANDQG
jgi:hypothetical protein